MDTARGSTGNRLNIAGVIVAHRPGRVALLLLCLLVAVPALPAQAAPLGDAEHVRADALDAAVRHLGHAGTGVIGGETTGRRSATEVLRSVRDHRDHGAWVEAVAQVVRDRSGFQTTTTTTASSSEPDECCGDGEPYTGSLAGAASAGGDLDGDGGDDILLYVYDYDAQQRRLEGRRGSSGAPLWARVVSGDAAMAWPAGGDLTGDGTADLLELSLAIEDSYDSPCDWEAGDECYSETYTATFQWALTLVSGRTGAAAWTRTFDGQLTESWEYTSDAEAYVVRSDAFRYSFAGTAVAVLPFLADLTGDGHQLVVNVLDVEESFSDSGRGVGVAGTGAGKSQGAYGFDATTVVEIIDPASGVTGTQMVEDSGGMLALLHPIEQAGGDDLVWERSTLPPWAYECVSVDVRFTGVGHCEDDGAEAPTTALTLLDGKSLEEVWTATFEGWAYSFPVDGDLDADGRNDLVVYTEDEDWHLQAAYVSTEAGSTLWSDDAGVVAVGPLDGTAGDDLITAAYEYEETSSPLGDGYSYTETMTLHRRNGLTGEVFLSHSWTATSSVDDSGFTFSFPYAAGGGDGDGDGAPDVTAGILTFTEDESDGEWSFSLAARDSVAQSGATGVTLYEAPDGPVVFPTDDLDGDGLAEIAAVRYGYAGGSETGSFTPVRLTDGRELWTSSAAGYLVEFSTAGDLDGDGGTEVLRQLSTESGRRLSTSIDSLNGGTGQSRWNVSTES